MEDSLTRIPYPGGSGRIKTGPMAFEDDWPGLFIRGDELPFTAMRLIVRTLREDSHDALALWAENLLKQMEACIVKREAA